MISKIDLLLLALILGFFALVWFWMRSAFKAMSFDAMEKSGKQLMNLADATLQPLRDSMKQLNERQSELEKARVGAYAALSQQIEGLVLSEKELRTETTRLVQALKSPQIRGSWGEVHLRRVVELAGLVNFCDFFEQKTLADGARPDLIVRLPGDRQIAVDAKTPLNAYLEAAESQDETDKKSKLQEHAISLRKRMRDLSAKEYWKQFDPAPEYVILFLPAEAFFSAALQADPSLIEIGAKQNIIIATPTTLIAILRAVAHSWKQESLSKSASEISKLGEELYERVGVLCDHWNRVGGNLNAAVENFNKSIASLESRVLVSARKLKESGSLTKELPEIRGVEKIAREVSAEP